MVHFSGEIEGGSGHDLAHLLGAALLKGGWRYEPTIFRGDCPHHGAGPLWVTSGLAMVHFSGKIEGSSGHDFGTFTQGSAASRRRVVSTCHH